MLKYFVVIILVATFTSFAHSQSKGEKRKAIVDFEDELIQGDINKPELLYLLKQRQANYKRLIKFRKNFLPEMRKTTEDLRQSRGDN